METIKNQDQISVLLESLSNDHGEPHWFTEKRLAALDIIADRPLPTISGIDLQQQLAQLYSPDMKWRRSDKQLLKAANIEDADIQIVKIGQTTVELKLPDELDDQGVILTDLFAAFREHPLLAEKFFMSKAVLPDENSLTAYHAAFLNNGIFLYIPENVKVDQPIELHLIQDNTSNQAMVAHILIVAEKNAKASIITNLSSVGDQANPADCVTEIIAKRGSAINMTAVNRLGNNQLTYLKERATVGAQATVNQLTTLLNRGNTVMAADYQLTGHNARSQAKTVALTSGQQQMVIQNQIHGLGKQANGTLQQRGVQLGESHLTIKVLNDTNDKVQAADSQILALAATNTDCLDQQRRSNQPVKTRQQLIQDYFKPVIGNQATKSFYARLIQSINDRLDKLVIK